MIDWLQNEFFTLMNPTTNNDNKTNSLFSEIIEAYTHKKRYYHNEEHIYNLLTHLDAVFNNITDINSLKLAIWYHDIVYKSTNQDNEEKSSDLAKKRLKSIDFDQGKIEIIQKLIVSTKKHQIILNENNDNAYLLDIDLSILGSDWKTYSNYSKKIRKEYSIYPTFIYKKGRKKVLAHFLERDNLFFTDYFRNKYEDIARDNLQKEMNLLEKRFPLSWQIL